MSTTTTNTTATTNFTTPSSDAGYGQSFGSAEEIFINGKRRFDDLGLSPIKKQDSSFMQDKKRRKDDELSDKSKKYKCSICPRETSNSSNLAEHYLIHSGYKALKCEICLVEFSKIAPYKRHLKNNHGKKYPYECSVCNLGFEKEEEKQLHERRNKCYFCDICGRSFKHRKDHLMRHMRTHRSEPGQKIE